MLKIFPTNSGLPHPVLFVFILFIISFSIFSITEFYSTQELPEVFEILKITSCVLLILPALAPHLINKQKLQKQMFYQDPKVAVVNTSPSYTSLIKIIEDEIKDYSPLVSLGAFSWFLSSISFMVFLVIAFDEPLLLLILLLMVPSVILWFICQHFYSYYCLAVACRRLGIN